jgi:two-component system NarL family sensor kinase
MLQSIGLKLSIETLCQQFSDTETLFVAHQIEYPKKLISLDEELQIYRIIQEALSNSAKYAQANAAKVTILAEEGKQIFIEVRDNGKGFDVEKALNSANAFGLHSILQRAHYVGANAHISSSPKGTVVQIKISMTS